VKKLILLLLLLYFSPIIVSAQCECTNCPLTIPDVGTIVSQITISGSNNPIVGQNSQNLRAIRLHFTHDAIAQLTIRLRQPNNPSFFTIANGIATEIVPNVEFNICIISCFDQSNPDQGINNDVFRGTDLWQSNTTYTGSYYAWQGCIDLPFGSSIEGDWILEFIDNVPGGGGQLLGWSLDFVVNSGTECTSTCFQSSCQANGGNINPLMQTFCEGSPGLNFSIPPDFGNDTPDPALYDYYYVITDEDGAILAYLESPDLTNFPPGTYNICGLSVLRTDFSLLPQSGIGNNISMIQQGIFNQQYCADLSEGCRTIIIQSNTGNPDIIGPDEVCLNQLVNFELVGLDVSAWTSVTVTGPFSNFLSNNLPNVTVSWSLGPPTRTICANYNNGCISGTICKEVTIISPIPISINGPTTVCVGQVVEYSLSPAVDWDISVIGGNLISQTQTSFQIEWFENAGLNRVTVQYEGPCGTTGPVDLIITLTSFDLPASLNSPEFLCLLGVGQSSIPFNPDISNYIWSGTGISIQSGQGTNTVGYQVNAPGQAEICLEVETTNCGNAGPICETILIEEPIDPVITGPTEACIGEIITFTLEGLSENQWISNTVTGILELIDFNFPILTVAFASGSSASEEICIDFFSLCNGNEQICIPVNILLAENIEILGPLSICEGQTYIYEIVPPLSDDSEYLVTIIGGNLVSQSSNQLEIIWDDLQQGAINSISITINDAICGLQDPIVLEVVIFEPPILVIDVSNELCLGTVGEATTNTDILVSDFNWFGTGFSIVNGQGTGGPVLFAPENTGIIQLCVEASSICGLLEPVCADINVQELVPIDIEPLDPSCDFDFILISSGNSQNLNSWNQIGGPAMAQIATPNATSTNVTVTAPGIYMFEYSEDDGVCIGNTSIDLEILASPEVEIEEIFCEGGGFQLVLIINSTANPFFINGISIVGNQFVSDFFNSGESYDFTILDANNCETTLSGSFSCPCIASAGTMSDEQLNVCISTGEVVVGIPNNNAVLDINDIGLFVLHDNAGPELGTIFAINETGVFSFLPSLIPGQTYYISFVVGRELNNTFDLNDPCLSVSNGQPVVFFEDPSAILNNFGPFCGDGILETNVSTDVISILWESIDGPNIANIQDPSSATTVVTFNGEGTYIFGLTVSNLACTVSQSAIIEVLSPITIVNQNILCLDLNSYTLSFTITGSGSNYTINIPGMIMGNVFSSDPLDPSESYFISITDENGCSAEFSVAPINCSCGNFVGTMSNSLLIACASANEAVTATYNQNGTLLPSDIGVYILHDNSGPILGNIIAINNSGIFGFQPGINIDQTYFISFVIGSEIDGNIDLDDPCLQVSVGQPVIWRSDPIFTLETADQICGFTGILSLNLLDSSNEITWTVVNFPTDSPPGLSNFNTPTVSVNVVLAGEYTFSVSISNEACTSDLDLIIDFIEEPIPVDFTTTCLGNDQFFVSFTTQQDWIISASGTISGDTFTSNPLPTSAATIFTISNGTICETEIQVGPLNCNCLSSAGTMSLDTLFICESDGIINLSFNGDSSLDISDTSLFVIHTLSGTELGTVLFVTDQLSFDIPAQLELETLYFVSNVVTTITQDGEPNFNSPCISISVGQPIFIYGIPIFELPSDSALCFGQASLPFPNNNGGQFILSGNPADIDVSFISSPGIINLNPMRVGAFWLGYEETNGTCIRVDSFQVTFWDLPAIEQLDINCIDDFYIVELNISGGLPPYEVNGIPLAGNDFVSELIPTNTPFTLTIIDGRSCSNEMITINQNCDCGTNAGQISTPLLWLCDQNDINLDDIDLSGLIIPEGYERFFFLTDRPLWDPTRILLQNNGSVIPWSDDLTLGTTYYLFVIVTQLTQDGLPDFSSPCFSSSNVLPVLWRSVVEVDITGNIDACVGSLQNIIIRANGSLPAIVTIINNLGEEIQVELITNITEVSFTVSTSGQIMWEVFNEDFSCVSAITGSFIINAFEEEEIIILDPVELCNNSIFGSTLNLNNLLINGNEGAWSFNGENIENGIFEANGLVPDIYEIDFSTIGFADPCPGIDTSIFITVKACLCPELLFPDSIRFCSTEGTIILDELFNINIVGEWTVSSISENTELPILFNNQIDVTNSNGIFPLEFLLSSEIPEECPTSYSVILEVEKIANAGTASSGNIICAIGDAIILLDDYLIDADRGGSWKNNQGITVLNNISRSILSPGVNVFTYEVGGNICPLVTSDIELYYGDSLRFETIINQAICPDESSTVEIAFQNSIDIFTIIINNVEQVSTNPFNISAGRSSIQVIDSLGCFSDIIEIEVAETENIVVDLGPDRIVTTGSSNLFTYTTNVPSGELASITWLLSGQIIQSNTSFLELTISEDQTIQVILITLDGCTATAEVNLVVDQAPVYIPTAFYPGSIHSPNQRFGPLSPNGIISIESFQIFDRWGNKIWEISNIVEVSEAVFWDGTFKSREAMEGVYVYKLIYTNSRGKSIATAGEVLLLK
jgi:hypothetical protein